MKPRTSRLLCPNQGYLGLVVAVLAAWALSRVPPGDLSFAQAAGAALAMALIPGGLLLAVFGAVIPSLGGTRLAWRTGERGWAIKAGVIFGAFWLSFLLPMLARGNDSSQLLLLGVCGVVLACVAAMRASDLVADVPASRRTLPRGGRR